MFGLIEQKETITADAGCEKGRIGSHGAEMVGGSQTEPCSIAEINFKRLYGGRSYNLAYDL